MADDITIKSGGNAGQSATGGPKPAKIKTGLDLSSLGDGDDKSAAATAAAASSYTVPAIVTEKFPDLITLIKETESMNEEERNYWFQILPIMTEDQIKKFRDILVTEKEQLASLDKEYEKELQKLNEKHLLEWKDFEAKEKRKALTTAEDASKAQEQAGEEELLKRLSQV